MKKLTNTKVFWCSALISLGVFVALACTITVSLSNAAWAESVAFWGLTYICLNKFRENNSEIRVASVFWGIMIGRLIFEFPIHIVYFSETFASLLPLVSSIVGIICGLWCYKRRNTCVIVVSFIIILLLNSMAGVWGDYANELLNK